MRKSLTYGLLLVLSACPNGVDDNDAGIVDATGSDSQVGSDTNGNTDSAGSDASRPDNFVASDAAPRPDTAVWDDAGTNVNIVELFGIGDSVTRGFCATAGKSYFELLLHNDDTAYPAYDGKDLASHFSEVNPMASTYNRAINGATSCDFADMREQLVTLLGQTTFTDGIKLLVVTLGGNDLIHDYGCDNPVECAAYCAALDSAGDNDVTAWAANFKTRMIDLLGVAQAGIPGQLHIFLANIYDPTDGIGDLENVPNMSLPAWPDGLAALTLYNQKIQEICNEVADVHCVDMHGTMLGHGIHFNDTSNPHYDSTDPTYWYCESLLEDPSDRGYSAIRGAFWSQIETVLGL